MKSGSQQRQPGKNRAKQCRFRAEQQQLLSKLSGEKWGEKSGGEKRQKRGKSRKKKYEKEGTKNRGKNGVKMV